MRSRVLIRTAICIVLALGLAAGCGGEQTDQAQKLIDNGSRALTKMDTEFYAYLDEVERAVAVLRENPPTEWKSLMEDFPEQVGRFRAHYSSLKAEVAGISSGFRRVYDLIGVEEYRKYSDLRIKYLAEVDAQLEVIEDYIGSFFNIWDTVVPNPPENPEFIAAEIEDAVIDLGDRYGPHEEAKQQLAEQAEFFKWQHAL